MAVCLHCLHAARLEAREHRQRAIMRFGAWTLSLVVVGIVGAAGVNAATHPDAPTTHPDAPTTQRPAKRAQAQPIAVRAPSAPDSTAVTVASAAAVIQQGAPATAVGSTAADSAPAATPSPAPAPTPAIQPTAALPSSSTRSVPSADSAARSAIGPIIPQGRTDLADSLFAIRVADTVVVHFDTSPSRTRRADKFETIVRQTLKVVYGPFADSALAAVPAGRLVAPNELVTTLPTRGIHLAGPHGARVALWPETRPGRDGPLVIAYRTVVER